MTFRAILGGKGLIRVCILCCLWAMLLFASSPVLATFQSAEIDWRTGKRLDEHLELPISVTWADAPLRTTLANFSRQQQVAIFLDRRVDPGSKISLSLHNATFEQVLWAAADRNDWGVCRLDDFYYFGPAETARILPVLWDQIRTETQKNRRKYLVSWSESKEMTIEALSNPADELDGLAQQNDFKIYRSSIDHDRWPEIRLPALSLDQRVAMLCVGFGKWFERSPQGDFIRFVPLPHQTTGTRRFPLANSDRSLVKVLREKFPECELQVTGKTLKATGDLDQLASIRVWLVQHQRSRSTSDEEQRRYTLKTRAARGSILATIAQQTGNQLEYDPILKNELQQHISIDLRDATLDQMIEETLSGLTAKHVIEDGMLKILPLSNE